MSVRYFEDGGTFALLQFSLQSSQFIFNFDYLFFNFQCYPSMSWVTLVCGSQCCGLQGWTGFAHSSIQAVVGTLKMVVWCFVDGGVVH